MRPERLQTGSVKVGRILDSSTLYCIWNRIENRPGVANEWLMSAMEHYVLTKDDLRGASPHSSSADRIPGGSELSDNSLAVR